MPPQPSPQRLLGLPPRAAAFFACCLGLSALSLAAPHGARAFLDSHVLSALVPRAVEAQVLHIPGASSPCACPACTAACGPEEMRDYRATLTAAGVTRPPASGEARLEKRKQQTQARLAPIFEATGREAPYPTKPPDPRSPR